MGGAGFKVHPLCELLQRNRMAGVVSLAGIFALFSFCVLFFRFYEDVGHIVKISDVLSTCIAYVSLETFVACSAMFLLLYWAQRKMTRSSRKIIINHHEDQVGYLVPPGRTKKEAINLLRQVKRAGEIPPLYPNSWYEVMRSEDLSIGEVKAVSLIEKHLVVFRSEKGKVCIMDAYCPHLGANIGVGGIVKGDCIKCPFHGWEFDGETGKCMNIPYTDKIPAFAKTNVWHSIERNGIICVWFDAEDREPPYLPEDLPQIATNQWTYRGCCVHYVNAHIQVRTIITLILHCVTFAQC